jgi:hypothetical protein
MVFTSHFEQTARCFSLTFPNFISCCVSNLKVTKRAPAAPPRRVWRTCLYICQLINTSTYSQTLPPRLNYSQPPPSDRTTHLGPSTTACVPEGQLRVVNRPDSYQLRFNGNIRDQPFRFLDLPAELRLMVYECLPVKTTYHKLNYNNMTLDQLEKGEEKSVTFFHEAISGSSILFLLR